MRILVWPFLDEPNTPEAMAAALPLADIDAEPDYRSLPMPDAPPRDFVHDLFVPMVDGATRDALPDAAATVVVGASASAMVALEIAASVPVTAVVLISPAVQLRDLVEANARVFGVKYEWDDASNAAADRLDFVVRAHEIRAPVLIISGADDEDTFREGAQRLWQALPAGQASLITVPGMGHSPTAAVDALVTEWLRRQPTLD